MTMDLRSGCEAAQRFCDDVVTMAGFFKPNAPGRGELRGLRAMSERQLMKSRGVYLSERILVAVTPVEVVAIALDAAAFGRTRRRVWTHEDLRVDVIPSRAGAGAPGPALCLSRHGRSPVIEIAPIMDDDASASVVERLLREKPFG
jgi:hypothetical protein